MKHKTRRLISVILIIAIIAAAAAWLCVKYIHFGNVEYTDNARIDQQIVPVSSRVQGYIKEIRFSEFQPVHKGDTLIIIDDSDLRLAVARARADLAGAQAARSVADRSVDVAGANRGVSRASVDEARVRMEQARTDLERYTRLIERDAVTRREYDAAKADFDAAEARYNMLCRQSTATGTVVSERRQQIALNEANIELMEASLAVAELNLSYAVITAPCDGYASRKEIQTGQLVQPGQVLLDVIDATDVWVTANYKETQLQHIAIGSPVDITVDAIPGVAFRGTVTAISRATGAAVSLMPQDNSAGNFVKVRQRVPVRIAIDADNDAEAMKRLRAGLNVECTVRY